MLTQESREDRAEEPLKQHARQISRARGRRERPDAALHRAAHHQRRRPARRIEGATAAPSHTLAPGTVVPNRLCNRDSLHAAIVRARGRNLADRLVPPSRSVVRETPDVHPSHAAATALLAPHKRSLGRAYATLHLLARWSIEHATESDPAPHLLTTYWSLEEALGKSGRTLMRYLVEQHHPWSATVRHLIDVRHNYGEMLVGDRRKPCIVGTVIRFFPKGRLAKRARVARWGHRDLIAESDAGRTRPCRAQRVRYERRTPRMSAYTSLKEQSEHSNWVMIHVGRPGPEESKSLADLYADIPKQHVLNALRADLQIRLARPGHNPKRARALWVDSAARVLAERFGDSTPNPHATLPTPRSGIHGFRFHAGKTHVVPADGFTGLWRKALWTALKAESDTGATSGWWYLDRLCHLATEGAQLGKRNPVAWAWTIVKREGFAELLRDYGGG